MTLLGPRKLGRRKERERNSMTNRIARLERNRLRFEENSRSTIYLVIDFARYQEQRPLAA